MIFTMFRGMTGWRRVLALSLHLVMVFSLYFTIVVAVDNYVLPSRIGRPDMVWPFFAIAVLAALLIASLVRRVSFVWPSLAMATAFAFILESFRLFTGEVYPDHRKLDVWAGAACFAIYFVLFWVSQRLAIRYKKMSAQN